MNSSQTDTQKFTNSYAAPLIRKVLVVGSGSAGLVAALALKRKIPQLNVCVVRDPALGVIGVGEGTTPNFPDLLFNHLGIPRKTFYDLARPTWKLGIRFKWGPRGHFDYTFARQLDDRWKDLPRCHGYYCEEEFSHVHVTSSLMSEGRVFPRQQNGCPAVQGWHAFHIENETFVAMLERFVVETGIEIIDGNVEGCTRGEQGIESVCLKDGRKLTADLYVDCSGFRRELIGKTLNAPFLSFKKTLFCDRAVVGGWERTTEPILPYTTAEQMSTGWCWQIEHENRINRGYVYCSDMISDEQALEEFRSKNPKIPQSPRIVRFDSGCYAETWVDNVVALGNSAGFVEPLEATALMVLSLHALSLVDVLLNSECRPTPSLRKLYNDLTHPTWIGIRDFLGLHYKPNTSLDTPFWKRCREETDLSNLQALLDFYGENGPTPLCRYTLPSKTTETDFGIEGFLVMLVGMKYPYRNHPPIDDGERGRWEKHRTDLREFARSSMTVEESLAYVHHPGWQWNADESLAQTIASAN